MTEPEVRKWLETAREVLDIEVEGLAAVREQLNGDFAKAVEMMAHCTGRVVITGLGKSGLVGRKIAATLSSTGTPSFFLHPVEGAHGDMGMIRSEDVILAISNSGETDELNAILPTLKSLGAGIVGLTAKDDSSLAGFCDAVIRCEVPREACPLGLAPTASTTAALAVGDALAVCLINLNSFDSKDFKKFHPGGALGGRLALAIEELMHTDNIPEASSDADLGTVLDVLNKGGLGLAVITDTDRKLAGVLSDGDVRRLACAGELKPERSITEVMTSDPRHVKPGMTAAQVLDIMEKHQITVLPIVDKAQALTGVVHLHDLLGKGRLKFAG